MGARMGYRRRALIRPPCGAADWRGWPNVRFPLPIAAIMAASPAIPGSASALNRCAIACCTTTEPRRFSSGEIIGVEETTNLED
jgi:hypothetical protein